MLTGRAGRTITVMTTTEPSESFQIPLEAAEAYEATFVPAFFAQWAPILCDTAAIGVGQKVLDVACGTGIVARTAAERAGAAHVVGVDLNQAMLTVARRVRGDIDWRQGDVAALPLADRSFDAVLCQMALMFFPDRIGALREMARVATATGTVAVLVPASLDAQPAYGPFVDMAAQHAGREARSLLNTYFTCGDLDDLSRPVRPGWPARDRHRHPSRHGAVPVGGRARGHRGGKHPPGRTNQRRGLRPDQAWRPRGTHTVHRGRRHPRGALRGPHHRRPAINGSSPPSAPRCPRQFEPG